MLSARAVCFSLEGGKINEEDRKKGMAEGFRNMSQQLERKMSLEGRRIRCKVKVERRARRCKNEINYFAIERY